MENDDIYNHILELMEIDPSLKQEKYSPIITELKRIVKDDSLIEQGFLTQLTRTIHHTQEKQNEVKLKEEITKKLKEMSPDELMEFYLDRLKEQIEQSIGKDRFQKSLRLAQIREKFVEIRNK